MDDYTGKNVKKATTELKEKVERVKVTTSEEQSDAAPGTILRQEITFPGDKFSPRTTVEVRFVYAAYPNFQVPHSIIGMDIDDAKTYLESMGAQVMLEGEEKPISDKAVETHLSGVVVKCSPGVGTWYTQEEDNYVTLTYYY